MQKNSLLLDQVRNTNSKQETRKLHSRQEINQYIQAENRYKQVKNYLPKIHLVVQTKNSNKAKIYLTFENIFTESYIFV